MASMLIACSIVFGLYGLFGASLLMYFFDDMYFTWCHNASKSQGYSAWAHCDMVDGKMICKYCQKSIVGGGIYRFKQHLAGIGGHVKPCGAPNEVIGHIRA